MKKYFLFIMSVIIMGITSVYAAPIKIAASLPDLASVASYIGGDKVEVFSIAKSNSNPHFVEVLPSYMIKVSRAAVYLKVGLALDQWSDAIIDGSRNSKLYAVDCSAGIPVLQKPTGKVDASMGDVHPEGNPHYWLDPSNGIIIANNILAALKKVDSANSSYYEKNYENFTNDAEKRIDVWKSKMSKLAGQKIICYHSSWVYFASAFGLNIAGNVEPLPGIPPTGKHLSELISTIKSNSIKILLQETYFPDQSPKFLNRQTGIKVYKFDPSCNGTMPEDYWKHFEEIVNQISK